MAGLGDGTETDDLLGDVRAAFAGTEPVADEQSPEPIDTTPVTETAAERTERERDEGGRFKAKDPGEKPRETLTLKDKAPVAAAAPAEQPKDPKALPPEIDKEGKHLERIPPPVGWKGAAKVDWDRMPRNVREAVAAELNSVEQARAELAPLKELIDINRDYLVSQAGSVAEAHRQLYAMARKADTVDGAIEVAQHVLRTRGLDPRAVFGGQAQPSPQGQQPDLQAHIAQLVSQQLQPILGQFGQQQTQQLQSQIDAFAARPDRPYFNDVRTHMGALMERGQAKTMDEAYEMATWADPTIRASLMAAQTEAAGKAKADEVAKARRASGASLSGSPLPGVVPAAQSQSSSALDDVRAAFAEHSGA